MLSECLRAGGGDELISYQRWSTSLELGVRQSQPRRGVRPGIAECRSDAVDTACHCVRARVLCVQPAEPAEPAEPALESCGTCCMMAGAGGECRLRT